MKKGGQDHSQVTVCCGLVLR